MPPNRTDFPNQGAVRFDGPTPDPPEKLLAEYFSSSAVGLCVLDSELRYVSVNETLARINGISISDHLGRSVREVLREMAGSVEPEFRRVLENGIPAHFEICATLPARAEAGHWIMHLIPIKKEGGIVKLIGAVLVEVTAQKQLEQFLQSSGKELKQEMKRLQMLLEVSRLLSSNWDLPQIFPRISAQIRRVLQQEYASFALHDSNTGLLIRQAMDFPLGKGFTSRLPAVVSECPATHALETRTAKIFSREEIQQFESELARSFLAEGLRSLCCIPLLRPMGPLGVLVLGSTRRDAFKTEDLHILEQVASQFAIAVENHRAASGRKESS